ncbi:MAG: HNH endonuclease, partial [Treponema sp.]|nr:HNH endonuclease [Treponema sp.]
CFATALEGLHFCERHKDLEAGYGKRPAPTRRKSSAYHNMYNSSRWRETSRAFLRKYPYCFICGERATVADHIQPHRGDPALFYDESNLQPLCWKHHSAKTLKENNYFKKGMGE